MIFKIPNWRGTFFILHIFQKWSSSFAKLLIFLCVKVLNAILNVIFKAPTPLNFWYPLGILWRTTVENSFDQKWCEKFRKRNCTTYLNAWGVAPPLKISILGHFTDWNHFFSRILSGRNQGSGFRTSLLNSVGPIYTLQTGGLPHPV